jgi:hypothetical protein
MNNNLINETFNKHLNFLRNKLKLTEGEMDSSPSMTSKKKFDSEKYNKIGEYAKELLAKKSFYYEIPEGRLQLIHKIKSHFNNFYHNLGVQYMKDKELMGILDYIFSDDEQWVTAKDTRETDFPDFLRHSSRISTMARAMPPNPEKFAEFPSGLRKYMEPVHENFDEDADDKVDKFIKNAVMADSQMALMKNRDNLILIVKTFMEAIGNKPYSDRAVEMYIDRVAGNSSGYVSRLENPDIVVPGLGGKKDAQIDSDMAHLDDYDAEVEARKRLGYKGREEDDFKDVQKYVYGVKKEGI